MTLPRSKYSRAVLIGVSDYTQLPRLATVRNNIEALRGILTSSASWNLSPEHCAVVHDPRTPEELVDPILHAAEEASDALLIYYAGHGLKGPNRGELRLTRSTSRTGAPHTSTDYNDIRETLLGSTANRRVVILDCCYAASALGTMTDPASSIADDALIEGTYLIAAAGETESAMAEDGSGFTVFTGELIRLLSEGIPEPKCDLLDLDTVFSHLHRELRAKSRPLPHKRVRNSLGKLALARNSFGRAGELRTSNTIPVTPSMIPESQSEANFLAKEIRGGADGASSGADEARLHRLSAQSPHTGALWHKPMSEAASGEAAGSLPEKAEAVDPTPTPGDLTGPEIWPTVRQTWPMVAASRESPQTGHVEIIWKEILNRIKERRRFAWIILTQNVRIASFNGEILELAFSNEAAENSYRSNGIDNLLGNVIREDFGLNWKVRVGAATGLNHGQNHLRSNSTVRRPGQWPTFRANDTAARTESRHAERPQPVSIAWPPVRKPPPPEDFQRIQELWPKVLDEVGKRRRTFWYLLSQDCKPVGAVGKKILLGFNNEQARISYLSCGADKLLEEVATEILRFACKIEPMTISE
ncbi:caspase, EACC1-associated type [Streptomyces apricus]|uniref:caspase, EACC1-associated type n=1 Tax=Streptomyces apricus TaxID=1828112 RepID=UPI0022A7809C|nr:caspase family protein [Streptomyces apricus]